LAKKAKIFIMDESTANIDKKTDGIIQDILTQQLQTQTVLVIAHRINTIIDSDQVLVLDNGRLVEAGSPYELLCKEESHFKNLVQHTGKETAAELFEIAKQKAHSSEDHAADDEEATSPVVITI
jgi:ABC-type multidrug transport system fused ATPase/permease subunit